MAGSSIYYCFQLIMLLIIPLIIRGTSLGMGNSRVINYTQKLDHFGHEKQLSNHTFQQIVVVDDSHWAGAKAGAPILVMMGEFDALTIPTYQFGLYTVLAIELKALLVVIEHRFYGNSIPLGSVDLALANPGIRSCLTTGQALQDFVVIINSLKHNLSAHHSPIIVAGRGYGGALAIWFQMKYPHMTIGALASSTPLLYYGSSTPIQGYCDIVSNDYKDFDPTCYELLSLSWQLIDNVASIPNGLTKLSQAFKTCRPLRSADEVKLAFALFLSDTPQFDTLSNQVMKIVCQKMHAEEFTVEVFSSILNTFMSTGNCLNISEPYATNYDSPFRLHTTVASAWEWQRCNELIFPVGCAHKTMLPPRPFDMVQLKESCQKKFGIVPHSHLLSHYYGNYSVVDYLTKFGKNIIFSNGLKDPYSSGAILKDLSKTVTVTNANGSYAWESLEVIDDNPMWLEPREEIVKTCKGWINEFHHISKASNLPSYNLMIYFVELLSFILYVSLT